MKSFLNSFLFHWQFKYYCWLAQINLIFLKCKLDVTPLLKTLLVFPRKNLNSVPTLQVLAGPGPQLSATCFIPKYILYLHCEWIHLPGLPDLCHSGFRDLNIGLHTSYLSHVLCWQPGRPVQSPNLIISLKSSNICPSRNVLCLSSFLGTWAQLSSLVVFISRLPHEPHFLTSLHVS